MYKYLLLSANLELDLYNGNQGWLFLLCTYNVSCDFVLVLVLMMVLLFTLMLVLVSMMVLVMVILLVSVYSYLCCFASHSMFCPYQISPEHKREFL